MSGQTERGMIVDKVTIIHYTQQTVSQYGTGSAPTIGKLNTLACKTTAVQLMRF